MLHFLTPVFNSRSSQGNYTDESSQQEQLESQENSSETQVATDTTEVENIMRSPSPPVTVTNKKRKQDVPTQILGLLQKRNQQINPSKEEDDDTKFLLSFRSEIRKMNDNQKIEFKIGMLQLVKKIHESRYISPGPSSLEINYSPMSAPSSASNLSSVSNTGPCSQFSCDGKIFCGAKLQQ
ncbi:hypothetical protein NQ315_003234 [Exocentrus adspersus]|uniref:BESS domain-containing protein n=1 Tax=Exocentrus adspersus TaxID=1586481 RepID=A0AAV8VNF8_9CUCU|nr:hypothetical protein NQ315_003234 [Exocentrus adspersus]